MDLSEEKLKELRKTLTRIPLPEFKGIRFPATMPIRKKGVEKVLQDVREIHSRESDIMICTYPKSGTHWVNEVTNMLVKKTELDNSSKVSTMLEVIHDLSVLDALPSPRLLNTHLSLKYLPKKHIKNRCKIIQMIRNPKDVCVSFYYHAKSDPLLDFTGSSIWIMNSKGEIQRLANFLGIPCNDKTITNIAETTSFDNMQQNKLDITKVVFGKGFIYRKGFYGSWYIYEKEMDRAEKLYPDMILTCFYEKMKKRDSRGSIYRKGKIGDWQNHFTVAQNDRFDEMYSERFKNSTYTIDFE
ncbi:sulfotransferase 1C4-like [Mytilus trossulus]|uniref:sulfotransferase 1C4-like n=1 Tax=Mytilus trossulus TaxID=6551 RepID=UPI003005E819